MTEADVQNEEMYEEEDDFPPSYALGLSSGDFQFRMRMQAYMEQQLQLRQAVYAAAAHPLQPVSTPPIGLRDYYQRFAQQYPVSLHSNQYYFRPTPAQIPVAVPQNPSFVAPPSSDSGSPSLSESHSSSPKTSPVKANNGNRYYVPSQSLASSTFPYSINNSQRSRRAMANPLTEQLVSPSATTSIPVNVKSNFDESLSSQPASLSQPITPWMPVAPFTTQLPSHVQQFYLPDFNLSNDPLPAIPDDNPSSEDIASLDWTSLVDLQTMPKTLDQQTFPANKATPFEDGSAWEDYFNSDPNWFIPPAEEDASQ